jgi:uncharacterized Ntn-hydrolase superfamily protein
VAWDPEAGQLGVATQSKFLAVGSVVPWARAGVGAVATQSWANTSFGPRGLDMLEAGKDPQETLDALLADDAERESRQVGIVDTQGRAAAFTGAQCFAWAGHRTGANYACQGNILVGEETVAALEAQFEATRGEELADRLVAALAAAQEAGGDSRGQQSAALLVVQESGGYGGFNDRYLDLRVDDHARPIEELDRLVTLHKLYYPRPNEPTVAIDGAVAGQIAGCLQALGHLDRALESPDLRDITEALRRFSMEENLEERLRDDGRTYQAVIEFLKKKAQC